MAAAEQLFRGLSYHERYSLIRHNLGFPPVVCCAAVGHGGSSVVTAARSSLERNVASLLQTDALLSCHIHDARGLTPRFARSGKGVHVDEVLMADEEVSTLHPDSLLATQINASASNFDVSRAPLWNVRVLRCGDRFAVVLNCHHIVADGRGMANLLEVLLSEGELPPPQLLMGVVKAMEEIPPSAEDSVPGYHLGQAGRLLVRAWSAIPPWIKGYLEGPSSWPGEKALVIHPTEAELSYHVLTLKGHEPLQTLKQQANKHGLRTIHPLFHMACVIALSSIVPDGTRIACDSPMSERVAERHTLCTGNYVSAHGTEMCVDGKADVWNETRSYAHQMSVKRATARQAFGRFGYYLSLQDKASFEPTEACPTHWEAIFHEKQQSSSPYRTAISLSNLGAIKGMPDYVDDVFWSQLSSPVGAVFDIDVCGWGGANSKKKEPKDDDTGTAAIETVVEPQESRGGGLSITVGLRRGTVGLELQEHFVKALAGAVHAFLAGIDEGTTLAEVSATL